MEYDHHDFSGEYGAGDEMTRVLWKSIKEKVYIVIRGPCLQGQK